MSKQWVIKQLDTNKLPQIPEYSSLVIKLLALRGITDPEEARDFLVPDYAKLHDPFLFKDMKKTVDRIMSAIANKEKITIYADYDADAITACAVLYQALKKLGASIDAYIPDRFTEGYGMNVEAINQIAQGGSKLIITVDCGINAVVEVEAANSLGVDVIITDHHELTGELPQALGIINPKNPHDKYPFQYLTGVGVAFKLVQALAAKGSPLEPIKGLPFGWEKWLLDLVALGTVADLQSLTDENRILVSFGLKVLAKTKWPGLKALLETANLSGRAGSGSAGKSHKFDTFTLGFILAPRINAAGRIKHANIAFQLLISEDSVEAEKLAKELNDLNLHRQNLTEQIMSEARAQIEVMMDKKVFLVVGQDWPKGVVGLVAGKLTEEYNRPVLALSIVDEFATGSGRSVAGFDLVAALGSAKDLLEKYGGHTQAAGFTLRKENVQALNQKLLEYAESLNQTLTDAVLEIDLEVESGDITWDNLNYIESLAPFGIGNPKPKFVARNLQVIDSRLVGTEGKHFKMRLLFGEHNLESIAFGQGFLAKTIRPGVRLDAVFELTTNEWNGNKEMQLKILDVKII